MTAARFCCSLAGLLVLVAGAPLFAQPVAVDRPVERGAQVALDEFAFDLYRTLAGSHADKNVFLSPYSLVNALVICAEGARGETALEMGQTLRLPKSLRRDGKDAQLRPWDLATVHSHLAATNKRLNARTGNWEVNVANALWIDHNSNIRKLYLDAITKHHGGGIYGVDFHKDARGSIKQINAWADRETRGGVKELISENTTLDRLVITNAIHFSAAWAQEFSDKDTKDGDFTLADGNKVTAKMMSRSKAENVRYGAFEADGSAFSTPKDLPLDDKKKLYPDARGFSVLEMPYKGGELTMVLLVPRSETGLASVEKALKASTLTTWLGKLEKRSVNVRIPRFTMTAEYDAVKALQSLGMKRAFIESSGKGGADFDGISGEKLHLTQVIHKVFVNVNERGTEAAAATAISGSRGIGGPFTPAFEADKPFVFVIRDTKTGTILFVGRVHDPRAKG